MRSTLGYAFAICFPLALSGCSEESQVDQGYVDKPVPWESAASVNLRASFRAAFDERDAQERVQYCRMHMYEQVPYAAPVQALAISAERIEAYFYLSTRHHAPTHLVCDPTGVRKETSKHPYASLLPTEREVNVEAPELPYQDLWGETWKELREPTPQVVELFVRPDTGGLVVRRWFKTAAGWSSELEPADAPVPGFAVTGSNLPNLSHPVPAT